MVELVCTPYVVCAYVCCSLLLYAWVYMHQWTICAENAADVQYMYHMRAPVHNVCLYGYICVYMFVGMPGCWIVVPVWWRACACMPVCDCVWLCVCDVCAVVRAVCVCVCVCVWASGCVSVCVCGVCVCCFVFVGVYLCVV